MTTLRKVAGALLIHPSRKVLLHHRDDKPSITNPGKWALFGGHIDLGESPADAIIRELHEEIGLQVKQPQLFTVLHGVTARYHMFLVPIIATVEELVLTEGQGMAYYEPETALQSLNLTTTARAVLNMYLAYEQFRKEETGSITPW